MFKEIIELIFIEIAFALKKKRKGKQHSIHNLARNQMNLAIQLDEAFG